MEIIRVIADDALQQITYLVLTTSCNILIDCGCSYAEINKQYKKRTKATNDVKIDAILLTHVHFDHIIGLRDVCGHCDCPVFVADGAETQINNPICQCANIFGKILDFVPSGLKTVKNGEILTIGDNKIVCYHTKGHAPSCVCYDFGEILFTGDTLFLGSCGRTDLWGGNPEEMEKSLSFLESLPQKMCFPGHGINFWLK